MTEIILAGEKLVLLPEKAVFWAATGILFISDLHLGKIMHFRKAGIALPNRAGMDNYVRLEELIQKVHPTRLIFLGDLFHSYMNQSWKWFCAFRQKHAQVEFDLVAGNHDILDQTAYREANIRLYEEGMVLDPFFLTHYPSEKDGYFNLCGHIHPGIRLKGKARQSLKLSCYWVRPNQMVLPAFGIFTGVSVVKPSVSEVLFAIANDEIVKIGQ